MARDILVPDLCQRTAASGWRCGNKWSSPKLLRANMRPVFPSALCGRTRTGRNAPHCFVVGIAAVITRFAGCVVEVAVGSSRFWPSHIRRLIWEEGQSKVLDLRYDGGCR